MYRLKYYHLTSARFENGLEKGKLKHTHIHTHTHTHTHIHIYIYVCIFFIVYVSDYPSQWTNCHFFISSLSPANIICKRMLFLSWVQLALIQNFLLDRLPKQNWKVESCCILNRWINKQKNIINIFIPRRWRLCKVGIHLERVRTYLSSVEGTLFCEVVRRPENTHWRADRSAWVTSGSLL